MTVLQFFLGRIAANWRFFAIIIASAILFLFFMFPFNDLSDLVTSAVARATGNQIYVQSESLDIHFLPQPAVSADRLSVETSMAPIEIKWAKITPGIFNTVLNLGTFLKAANGDPEASRTALSKVSFALDARGVWGGDIDLSLSPGKKGEQGRDLSRLSLAVEKIDLAEFQRWAELPLRLEGRADVETDMQMAFDFSEQPSGEISLKIKKLAIPASTVSTPMGPINMPAITLANVTLRGRMVGGALVIEEGVFGKSSDPLSGRIKGQVGLRIQSMGNGVVPLLSAYNLTVELNTSAYIQKELSFAFIFFDSAKSPSAGGGARYLFRATGQGIGNPPQITRVDTF